MLKKVTEYNYYEEVETKTQTYSDTDKKKEGTLKDSFTVKESGTYYIRVGVKNNANIYNEGSATSEEFTITVSN